MLFANRATAWEFAESNICTLTHDTQETSIALTFDPSIGVYDIAITLMGQTWGDAPAFRIVFDGPNPLAIGTDRQVISDNQTRLSVSNSGFGNVLDGIQFNETMTASLGDQSVTISLDGASDPMAAFRLCPSLATS